jgi:hypothetical protein
MLNPFFARPPKAVVGKSLIAHSQLFAKRFGYLVWQILVPFEAEPEPIGPFPESDPQVKVSEQFVKQCQWIFDQAEQRKNQLEQKAQSTFGIMVFLAPLLTSAFVFVIGKTTLGYLRTVTVALVGIAAIFVVLAFVAAARAVGVKASQTLSLGSVLKDDGTFRTYDESFHAKGLLHCASMNTAINDHLAQFVRGTHTMTAAAILLLIAAAFPTGLAAMKQGPDVSSMKIVAPVEVEITPSSKQADLLNDDNAAIITSRIKQLEGKVAQLESRQRLRAKSPANHRKISRTTQSEKPSN